MVRIIKKGVAKKRMGINETGISPITIGTPTQGLEITKDINPLYSKL